MTCDEVVTAMCAIASTGQPYTYSGQDVRCDRDGLECIDGPMQKCLDYKIKFYCSCKAMYNTTTYNIISSLQTKLTILQDIEILKYF